MASQTNFQQFANGDTTSWFDSVYYDLLKGEVFKQHSFSLIQGILEHLDITSDNKIMDLSCAQGNLAFQLALKGYHVNGFETSKSKLKEARQYKQANLSYYLHNFNDNLGINYYSFAYILDSHFGRLESEEEQINFLKNIKKALKPNGYFLIDFVNIFTYLPNLPQQRFHKINNVHYQLRSQQKQQFIQTAVKVHDGSFQGTFIDQLHIHFRDSFEYLLLRAGLRIVRCYGDYQMNPYIEETSSRLILLIEKR